VAQQLFHRRGVVKARDFPFVYWEGMEQVMKSFPEMFRVWVTKHVSHFQGTNRQLSRIDRKILNVCPSCGCQDEATSHITHCRDNGRTRVFTETVQDLVQWLRDQQTSGEIIYLFRAYLLARGTRTMRSLLRRPGSKLGVEANYHDRLGWDSFLEGWVCVCCGSNAGLHILDRKSKSDQLTFGRADWCVASFKLPTSSGYIGTRPFISRLETSSPWHSMRQSSPP
jgi:hypothetical protein